MPADQEQQTSCWLGLPWARQDSAKLARFNAAATWGASRLCRAPISCGKDAISTCDPCTAVVLSQQACVTEIILCGIYHRVC